MVRAEQRGYPARTVRQDHAPVTPGLRPNSIAASCYTWNDSAGNKRASDDGDPLPPAGGRGQSFREVARARVRWWGTPKFPRVFPRCSLSAFSAATPKSKARRADKFDLVLWISWETSIGEAGLRPIFSGDREEGSAQNSSIGQSSESSGTSPPVSRRRCILPGLRKPSGTVPANKPRQTRRGYGAFAEFADVPKHPRRVTLRCNRTRRQHSSCGNFAASSSGRGGACSAGELR